MEDILRWKINIYKIMKWGENLEIRKWFIVVMLSSLLAQNVMGQLIQPSRDCIIDIDTKTNGERLLVKSRDIETIFGLKANIDSTGKKVIISEIGNVLELTVGSNKATFNNREMQIEEVPLIKEKTVYVPLEVVEKVFCYELQMVDGRIVVNRPMSEESLSQLIALDEMIEKRLEELNIGSIYGILDDYEFLMEQAKKGWFTKVEYQMAAKEVAKAIDQIIVEIEKEQTHLTPMACLIMNQEIELLQVTKNYFNITPWEADKKEKAFQKADALLNERELIIEKITSKYYGYESSSRIEDIMITFDVAEKFIYKLDYIGEERDGEEAALLLKAKRLRLQSIKEELKEEAIIEGTTACIEIIDQQLALMSDYEKATPAEKQKLLDQQQVLFEQLDNVTEKFIRRYSNILTTVIDDGELSGEMGEAICNKDAELLSTYRFEILDLVETLDLMGAKYVQGITIQKEYKDARKTLEELVRKDETIKSMLVDEASKDYLVLKEQVLVESSNILKLLENNKYDKKELLAYLNQLEKIGNELSLRGYLVYKEIDGE